MLDLEIIYSKLPNQDKIEYKKSIIYVVLLNFISFSVSWIFTYWDKFAFYIKDIKDINLSILVMSSEFIPFFTLWIVISIIIGLILALSINKNTIYKIANFLGISRKTSNLQVWNDVLNMERKSNYIIVRDMKNKLIYSISYRTSFIRYKRL
jgi:hypothetical protein